MQQLPIQDPYNKADLFIHGLCALLAHDIKEQYPFVQVVSIHDYEYIDGFSDSPSEVLVHMAVKLPDGRILDGKHLFENTLEFQQYIEDDFEEMTGFELVSPERTEKMLKEQIVEIGTFSQNYKGPDNIDEFSKQTSLYYDQYMDYVDKSIFNQNTRQNN